MCIATVYLNTAGKSEEVLQDVVTVEYNDNNVLLTTILGEKKQLKATIKHIDFLKHTLTIQPS